MEDVPMFDIRDDGPDLTWQVCQDCGEHRLTTDNRLRAAGWIVYDGPLISGEVVHVRICKECQ